VTVTFPFPGWTVEVDCELPVLEPDWPVDDGPSPPPPDAAGLTAGSHKAPVAATSNTTA
jgi:hypothetical protein